METIIGIFMGCILLTLIVFTFIIGNLYVWVRRISSATDDILVKTYKHVIAEQQNNAEIFDNFDSIDGTLEGIEKIICDGNKFNVLILDTITKPEKETICGNKFEGDIPLSDEPCNCEKQPETAVKSDSRKPNGQFKKKEQ
jgi:hypothetical protein